MVFKDIINNYYKEKLLVEDIPDERSYSKYLGKIEWISCGCAKLYAKDISIINEKIDLPN